MFVDKHSHTPRGRSPPNNFAIKFDKEAISGGFFNSVTHTIIEYNKYFLRENGGAPRIYKGLIYLKNRAMHSIIV